jgi:hypothetical protein
MLFHHGWKADVDTAYFGEDDPNHSYLKPSMVVNHDSYHVRHYYDLPGTASLNSSYPGKMKYLKVEHPVLLTFENAGMQWTVNTILLSQVSQEEIVELYQLYCALLKQREGEIRKKEKKDKLKFGIAYLAQLNSAVSEIDTNYKVVNTGGNAYKLKKNDDNVFEFKIRRASEEKDFKLVHEHIKAIIDFNEKFRVPGFGRFSKY